MICKRGATYIITALGGGKGPKEHTFSCGKHLGDAVRDAIEAAHKCKVKVAYCPAPGDQPCVWGVR